MLNVWSYADMAELADAPDLGSGGRPCRFDSCYPHFSAFPKSGRLFVTIGARVKWKTFIKGK